MAERMVFFRSYLEGVEGFDDSIQLEVLKAIIRYGLYGEEPENLSPVAKLAFTYARPSLEKSNRRGEIARENGKKGGRRETQNNTTETQENPKEPTETQDKPTETAYIVYKTKDYKTIDIDSKTIDNKTIDLDLIDKDTEKKGCSASKRKEEVEAVLDAWNSIPGVPSVKMLDKSTDRYKMLCARLDKYGLDAVLEAVNNVRHSSFLCGGGDKGWKADFGWFVKPNNFPKVYEGKYLDSGTDQKPSRAFSIVDEMIARGELPI